MNQYNTGARSASYSYGNEVPAKGGAAYRSVSAAQPGHHGVFVADDDRKPISPIPFHRNDVVARHLLIETALLDSQDYELLPIEEVDALKKEKAQLDSRLESTRRKLALESKVRDAAQSLHRLYSTRESSRPSTPQSPKKRGSISIFGEKGRTASGTLPKPVGKAGDELEISQKKIDDLLQILSGLESRRQYVESRLLRHTAAVLQVAHQDENESRTTGHGTLSVDSDQTYFTNTPNEFGYEESIYSSHKLSSPRDSPRDLGISRLNSGSIKVQKRSPLGGVQDDPAQRAKMTALQSRFDSLNGQMRALIKEARDGRSSHEALAPEDVPVVRSEGQDVMTQLENQAEILDNSLAILEQELLTLKDRHEDILDDVKHQQGGVEEQLEGINNQLYILLTASRSAASPTDLEPPPGMTGNSPQEQLNYLEESMLVLGDVLQNPQFSEESEREIEEAHAKAAEHADNLAHHETTLRGLWDIIGDGEEPYSLPGFNTRVQHMFDRASHHDVQMGILRRQIEQQRELNSKSDSEKDGELTQLRAAHDEKEAELEEMRARHVAAESEVATSRAEIDNIMGELERLKEAHQSNIDQKQQVLNELNEHRQRSQEHESVIADYETQLADLHEQAKGHQDILQEHQARSESLSKELTEAHAARDEAQTQLQSKHEEAANFESEVVRLTTELTMAKAELDGAYGSRAERARDLNTAEIERLKKDKEEHASQLKDLTDKHSAAEERAASLEQDLAALRAANESATKDDTRTALLEKELTEMSNEHQELTREMVEVEKERERTEAMVDRLREKCEELEDQLSDERVRWLGIKSPTVVNGDSGREATSTAVLRSEFKKMMRETRAEGVRLLRAEQEERRRLEAVVRILKREKGAARLSPRPSQSSLRPE
ncbi:hypothetical protein MBLNU457_6877t1 [Dothideomycetes sp. NU457]